MMPHLDPTRVYWEPDHERFLALMRASRERLLGRAEAGDGPAQAWVEAFEQPDLRPKPYEPPRVIDRVVHSLIEDDGDELRLELHRDQGDYWTFRLAGYTQGPDERWYPTRDLQEPWFVAPALVGALRHALTNVSRERLDPRMGLGWISFSRPGRVLLVYLRPSRRRLRIEIDAGTRSDAGRITPGGALTSFCLGSAERLIPAFETARGILNDLLPDSSPNHGVSWEDHMNAPPEFHTRPPGADT